jgi:hypothetical protein
MHAPAVASLNGPIANLAVTEFLAFVTGFKNLKRYVFYDFMNTEVVTLPFDKDPNCIICSKTASFAIGDEGEPLPAEMLLDEPVSQVKGDSHMETQTVTIEQSIRTLLEKATEKDFEIEGSPEGHWLLLKNVKTGRPIDKPKTSILVKFFENSNDPIILVPDTLDISKQNHICLNFIARNTYIKGWKPLCCEIFGDVGDDLFEFIVTLAGLIAKPSLCGLMGCTKQTLSSHQE